MAKKLTKKALPKGYGICLYCVRKQEEEEKGEESEQEGAEEQQQQEEKTEEQQQREIEPVKLIYSDLLKVSICRPCFSDVQTITKTTARERYLLTEKEVMGIRHIQKSNPHYRSAAPMLLFLEEDVGAFAIEKYGSEENIEEERELRRMRRENRKKNAEENAKKNPKKNVAKKRKRSWDY